MGIDVEGMPSFTVGSLSSLVGHYVNGYEVMAPWPDVQPNPATRDALPEDADRQFSDRIEEKRKSEERDTKPFYDEDSEDSASESETQSESDSNTESDSDSNSDSSSDDSSDSSTESSSSGRSNNSEVSEKSIASEESEEEVRKPLPIMKRQQGRIMKKVAPKKQSSASTFSTTTSQPPGDNQNSPFDLNLLDFTGPSTQQQTADRVTVEENMSSISAMDAPADIPPPQQMQYGLMQQQFGMQQSPMMQQGMMGMGHVGGMGMGQMGGMGMGQVGGTGMGQIGVMGMGGMMQQPMQSMGGQPMGSMGAMSMQPMQTLYGETAGQSNVMMMPQQQMMMPSQGNSVLPREFVSYPVTLFAPELCSGLAISLMYRNGAKPSIYANATCVMISVKATSEGIRRIKLTIPNEIKRTPALEEIPALAPGQEYTYQVEMVLQGFEGKKINIDA